MQQVEAARILKSLVEGRDPFTGQELPPDSALQQAVVLRALYMGHQSLESTLAREKRRAQLPDRVGVQWDDEEDRKMRIAFEAGETISELASSHRRTPNAIRARLERLGLMAASEGTAYLRYTPSEGGGSK